MKKILLVTLYIFLGKQAMGASPAINMTLRAPAAAKISMPKMKNICTIHSGDVGKLKYKADTYEKAFAKVTDECFKKRSQLYVKMRKHQPTQDRQIQFAESCVNSVKCI